MEREVGKDQHTAQNKEPVDTGVKTERAAHTGVSLRVDTFCVGHQFANHPALWCSLVVDEASRYIVASAQHDWPPTKDLVIALITDALHRVAGNRLIEATVSEQGGRIPRPDRDSSHTRVIFESCDPV